MSRKADQKNREVNKERRKKSKLKKQRERRKLRKDKQKKHCKDRNQINNQKLKKEKSKDQKQSKNTIKMVKQEEKSIDTTVNLHKQCHKISFKKKAPRAIREIVAIAKKTMGTDDVRIDTELNKFIWSNGIRNIPRRVRVRLCKRKNEEEGAQSQFYTLVQHLQVDSYHGLLTEKTKAE
ncbi:60S ribosomal protein L31, putative (macronuclear) [Tetrahymena thermophila SB210]|nr:60S ribosomal protein L31, putative [Tetrahymena thermophila SB210]EAR83379.2 60S ribosomal protein L31, putative [Tetrahymena thermophila SB210]|eukprot:XP_001031042.2 60S ribosomal protein L31, putative [Tetrahymena thermophila SB210]